MLKTACRNSIVELARLWYMLLWILEEEKVKEVEGERRESEKSRMGYTLSKGHLKRTLLYKGHFFQSNANTFVYSLNKGHF